MAVFRKPRGGIQAHFMNIYYYFHNNTNKKEFQNQGTHSKKILCDFLYTYWPSWVIFESFVPQEANKHRALTYRAVDLWFESVSRFNYRSNKMAIGYFCRCWILLFPESNFKKFCLYIFKYIISNIKSKFNVIGAVIYKYIKIFI